MKGMTIVYTVGDGLYVNLTNRCSNACGFCIRKNGDGAYGSNPLWLEREPTREEALQAIIHAPLSAYRELVFCGYGEPTYRMEDILWICREVKAAFPQVVLRLNTNGHAALISGDENAARRLASCLDSISISLNAPNGAAYQRICASVYGERSFDALVSFAKQAAEVCKDVRFTLVQGSISDAEAEECRKLAASLGIPLRIREYIAD